MKKVIIRDIDKNKKVGTTMVDENLLKMAQFISELRKEKNLTQKELAEQLGVTDKAVSKWERGLSYPDISLLSKLSSILGITTSELLKGEKAGPSNPEIEAMVETTLKYADTATKSMISKNRLWKYIIMVSATILLSFLILIGCILAIDRGLEWIVLPLNITVFIWLTIILGVFIAKKNRIGSLLLCGFFIYIATFYYSSLNQNQTPLRDIGTYNGFPKDYIPHYTIILVLFIVSVVLAVISFLIQNKKIPSDKTLLLIAASITVIILSILNMSSSVDYVDINFLGINEGFTVIMLLVVLINLISLVLFAIGHKRQNGQPKKIGS